MLISEKGIPKSPPVLCLPEHDTAQPPPGVQQREQPAPDPAVQRLEQPGGLPRCGMPHMQPEAGTGSRRSAERGWQKGPQAEQREGRADLPCLFTAGVRDHGCVLGMQYWASCVWWLRPTHARTHAWICIHVSSGQAVARVQEGLGHLPAQHAAARRLGSAQRPLLDCCQGLQLHCSLGQSLSLAVRAKHLHQHK